MQQRTMENVPNISRIMCTPYTPRFQERQRFDLSTRPEEEAEEIDTSGLEDLVHHTWNIYGVSALFDLKQDDIHFKLYSKKLREEIASNLSREEVTYDANFSIMENISRSTDENQSAIKIEVTAIKDSGDEEENIQKSIYKGIFLSWGIRQIVPNIQNSIRLPLLLCRGTRNCMDAVHNVLNRMFDCLIIPLPAKEEDLSWLLPIIIMTNQEEESAISGEVQMEYTVPDLPITDTITVKFHCSELRRILTAIITNQEDNIINTALNREHVEMFYEVLHTQMLTIGGLQLGLCTLHKITLPGISIMDNRMKVMNVDIMNHILLYLNEKAYDIFHAVHINL